MCHKTGQGIKRIWLWLSAATVMAGSPAVLADTLHVPGEYPTIQAAIDASADGDVVEIADGTYTGAGNKDLDFVGKAITVRSASGDPALCIIDCERAGRGFFFHSGESAAAVVEGLTIRSGLVSESSAGGNRGGGILCLSSDPTIANCTISGNRTSDGGPDTNGGDGAGIYCFASSPTIRDCRITENRTGNGGVEDSGHSGDGGRGAGICCMEGSSPTILRTVIADNRTGHGGSWPFPNRGDGGWGGGIYCESSELTISNGQVLNNVAGSGAQSARSDDGGFGGGICLLASSVTIEQSTISANVAGSGGSGYGSDGSFSGDGGSGGGVACLQATSLVLAECSLSANRSGNGGTSGEEYGQGGSGGMGGGLYVSSSSALMSDCTFAGNAAGYGGDGSLWSSGGHGGSGGACFIGGSSHGEMSQCVLTQNRAGNGGHGDINGGNGGDGGGIFDSHATLINCTVVGNRPGRAGFGEDGYGGDGGYGGGVACGSDATLTNSVLWGNVYEEISGSPVVTYSDVQGGWDGTGNIDADPLFIDPENGDFRLGSGSPCIDAADNMAVPESVTLDLDGFIRFVDDPETEDTGRGDPPIVDMGPYEFFPDCNENGIPDAQDIPLMTLLVASKETDSVAAYDGWSGNSLWQFLGPGEYGLDYPNGIATDTLGNVYVASVYTNSVLKISGETREMMLELKSDDLVAPVGLLFAEPSTLFVSSYVTDAVIAFDTDSGDSEICVEPRSGGLNGPAGLLMNSQGHLLVASELSDQVLEYDLATCSFVRVAAEGCGLSVVSDILLDNDGNLLVTNYRNDAILKFSAEGECMGECVSSGSGGLDGPLSMTWGPDGNLYVCSRWTDQILRYDRDDCSFLGVFAEGGGIDGPTYIAFASLANDCNSNSVPDDCDIAEGSSEDVNGNGIPDECERCAPVPPWLCDGDVDGDGQVNPVDSGIVQANFGNTAEQALCNYDLDCDGQINPVDAGIVQSLFGTCEAPRDACP